MENFNIPTYFSGIKNLWCKKNKLTKTILIIKNKNGIVIESLKNTWNIYLLRKLKIIIRNLNEIIIK